LSGGGTASGSFVYDADTNGFSAIDITSTGGFIRSGAVYTSPSSVGDASHPDFLDIPRADDECWRSALGNS
jgi:hypothetical protein